MFKDDDEEEENTFGVTRYPCMPSLVALQQMRNRLHLAFLGRKLMKWTALATGRELRRLAQELYVVYDGFAEDLRNAFILLARSRYFCPNLNGVVTEDIAKKAGVIVQQCGRTVSGVKIVQFEIFETEYPPYPHLGIEKGGQTILETKKAWLELLRRLILMMQLRAGFLMVELANRNANKKMNVLAKIVIPRTNVTMGYINNELEELAREEFFRLKKVLEIKRKMYGDKTGKKKAEVLEEKKIFKQNFSEEEEGVKFNLDELSKDKLLQDNDLMELIKQISELVDVTKDMDKRGLVKTSVDNFIRTAEEFKAKLNSTPKSQTTIDELGKEMDNLVREATEENSIEFEEKEQEEPPKLVESEVTIQTEEPPKLVESIVTIQTEEPPKLVESIVTIQTEEPPKSVESIVSIETSIEDTQVNESNVDFGSLESVVGEITKVIESKNEDGSISTQKKVQTETKAPVQLQSSQGQSNSINPSGNVSNQASSTSSRKSKSYTDSRTVGIVRLSNSEFKDKLRASNLKAKKAKSEVLGSFSPMSDPVERFCMSSVTLLSTDLDFDCAIYNDTYIISNPDWLCLKASNPMIEEIISSCEPGISNISPTTNTENCPSKSSSADINLDKKCSKKLGLSVSFNIKSPSSSASLDETNDKDKNK